MILSQIVGWGEYLPKKVLTNDNLSETIETSDEWIFPRTGIKQRHIALKKEFTSDLAINAAKEAFVKSLGTGFRNNLSFKDISILNNKKGKPYFLFNQKLKNILKKKYKLNNFKAHLSLSDEKKYSISYVILQKLK